MTLGISFSHKAKQSITIIGYLLNIFQLISVLLFFDRDVDRGGLGDYASQYGYAILCYFAQPFKFQTNVPNQIVFFSFGAIEFICFALTCTAMIYTYFNNLDHQGRLAKAVRFIEYYLLLFLTVSSCTCFASEFSDNTTTSTKIFSILFLLIFIANRMMKCFFDLNSVRAPRIFVLYYITFIIAIIISATVPIKVAAILNFLLILLLTAYVFIVQPFSRFPFNVFAEMGNTILLETVTFSIFFVNNTAAIAGSVPIFIGIAVFASLSTILVRKIYKHFLFPGNESKSRTISFSIPRFETFAISKMFLVDAQTRMKFAHAYITKVCATFPLSVAAVSYNLLFCLRNGIIDEAQLARKKLILLLLSERMHNDTSFVGFSALHALEAHQKSSEFYFQSSLYSLTTCVTELQNFWDTIREGTADRSSLTAILLNVSNEMTLVENSFAMILHKQNIPPLMVTLYSDYLQLLKGDNSYANVFNKAQDGDSFGSDSGTDTSGDESQNTFTKKFSTRSSSRATSVYQKKTRAYMNQYITNLFVSIVFFVTFLSANVFSGTMLYSHAHQVGIMKDIFSLQSDYFVLGLSVNAAAREIETKKLFQFAVMESPDLSETYDEILTTRGDDPFTLEDNIKFCNASLTNILYSQTVLLGNGFLVNTNVSIPLSDDGTLTFTCSFQELFDLIKLYSQNILTTLSDSTSSSDSSSENVYERFSAATRELSFTQTNTEVLGVLTAATSTAMIRDNGDLLNNLINNLSYQMFVFRIFLFACAVIMFSLVGISIPLLYSQTRKFNALRNELIDVFLNLPKQTTLRLSEITMKYPLTWLSKWQQTTQRLQKRKSYSKEELKKTQRRISFLSTASAIVRDVLMNNYLIRS
jgi:hypothetical protein